MRELAVEWYIFLNAFSSGLTAPLSTLAEGLGVPLIGVLLLGLIGAVSPCQLTTGAAALAYIARHGSDYSPMARRALAYALGKALVYTLGGGAVLLLGRQLAQEWIPAITASRLLVGPIMILLGLYLLRLVPLRFALGYTLTDWLAQRAGPGTGGAFLLGAAFAVTFCPTLFLLFFGLTIPLALRSPLGTLYPAVFALGTTLPLLALAGLLTLKRTGAPGSLTRARRFTAWLQPAAAVVLLLTGLHDTLLYWFL